MPDLHILDHPLVQHKLTLLRNKELSTRGFRALTQEIGALLAYEIMRDAPLKPIEVETPLGPAQGVELDGKKQVLVTILRAWLLAPPVPPPPLPPVVWMKQPVTS